MAEEQRVLGAGFVALIAESLRESDKYSSVEIEVRIANGLYADLIAFDRNNRATLIEVKTTTPLTIDRVDAAIETLTALRSAWMKTSQVPLDLILALPSGSITESRIKRIMDQDIEVWDETYLRRLLQPLTGHQLPSDLASLLSNYLSPPQRPAEPDPSKALSERLLELPCGRTHWYQYQSLCTEIFDFLFCPPLEFSLVENSNSTGVNRRDLIMPNYATEGFWTFMHSAYRAEYIVIETKNYCSSISKASVLQLSNYLSEQGPGLFGILMTRVKEDSSGAIWSRREQWLMNRKMIIVLADNDIQQMLSNRSSGLPAEEVIRQKIQDFRLDI